MGITSLPLSHLHHAPILLLGSNHQINLFNGVGNGLLHIYIQSGLAGLDHWQCMPVIRSTNNDSIQILVFKQFTVVVVQNGFLSLDLLYLSSTLLQYIAVYIAKCQTFHSIHLKKRFQVGHSHAIQTDGTYIDSFIGTQDS